MAYLMAHKDRSLYHHREDNHGVHIACHEAPGHGDLGDLGDLHEHHGQLVNLVIAPVESKYVR